MKYIILEDENGQKYPIVFPESLMHIDVSYAIKKIIDAESTVKTAGFCSVFAHCEGRSESLNVGSHKDDSLTVSFGESYSNFDIDCLPGIKETLQEQHDKYCEALQK